MNNCSNDLRFRREDIHRAVFDLLTEHLLSKDTVTPGRERIEVTTEAISKQPRKKWYELSAEGLIEAAKTVAEMTGPITTAVGAVLALLA